jgi:molecular chaperone DnaK (HSP70)
MAEGYSIGVDFGTTNSSIAIQGPGEDMPELIRPVPKGSPYANVIPSRIFLSDSGQTLVGREAGPPENRQISSGTYIANFKGALAVKTLQREVWEVVEQHTGEYDPVEQCGRIATTYQRRLEGSPYSTDQLIEASSQLIRSLFADKRLTQIMPDVEKITFGIPASFGDIMKKRLLRAAVHAKIVSSWKEAMKRIQFLCEPVAVSIASYEDFGDISKKVFVFDFGGGTLDLSLVEFSPDDTGRLVPNQLIDSKTINIGGVDFDKRIFESLIKPKLIKNRTDHQMADEGLKYWDMELTQLIKHDLSNRQQTTRIFDTSIKISLSKDKLEEAVMPFCNNIMNQSIAFITNLKYGLNDIDVVVMAGGMSCMPCIQNEMGKTFPELVTGGNFHSPDPKDAEQGGTVERALTATALGLARYGSVQFAHEKTSSDIKLYDKDLGRAKTVISKNTPYKKNLVEGNITISTDSKFKGFSLHIIENQMKDDVLLEYVDISLLESFKPGDEVDVKIKLLKESKYPTVYIKRLRSREPYTKLKPMENLSEDEIREFVESEKSIISCGGHESWRIEWSLIQEGDHIEHKQNNFVRGPGAEKGKVISIRNINTAQFVQYIDGADSIEYAITLKRGKATWFVNCPSHLFAITQGMVQ